MEVCVKAAPCPEAAKAVFIAEAGYIGRGAKIREKTRKSCESPRFFGRNE